MALAFFHSGLPDQLSTVHTVISTSCAVRVKLCIHRHETDANTIGIQKNKNAPVVSMLACSHGSDFQVNYKYGCGGGGGYMQHFQTQIVFGWV